MSYACHMWALPCLQKSLDLAGDCIEALSNPPIFIESIFPNLCIVELHEPSMTVTPLIWHLTNPKLTDILLEDMENLDTAIDAFGESCPDVTNFYALHWTHVATISDLICHWQNLSSVLCDDVAFSIDVFSQLSYLHSLLQLFFKVHDVVVNWISSTQPSASLLSFSALYCFSLSSDSLTSIWRLLHYLHLTVVYDLSVELHACLSVPNLLSFFVALWEACVYHDSLNCLCLWISSADAVPWYYIIFDHLQPLTAFVNIKLISFDISCNMDLNKDQLLHLASSWPHLKLFGMGKYYDWTSLSTLTLRGFLKLLERCRLLQSLFFMFDTCGYMEILQGHSWHGLTMQKKLFLHIHNSPIKEVSIKALSIFFHIVPYPDFSLTTSWNNGHFQGSEQPEEHCELYYNWWIEALDTNNWHFPPYVWWFCTAETTLFSSVLFSHSCILSPLCPLHISLTLHSLECESVSYPLQPLNTIDSIQSIHDPLDKTQVETHVCSDGLMSNSSESSLRAEAEARRVRVRASRASMQIDMMPDFSWARKQCVTYRRADVTRR